MTHIDMNSKTFWITGVVLARGGLNHAAMTIASKIYMAILFCRDALAGVGRRRFIAPASA